MHNIFKNLTFQVLTAIILGVLAGIYFPGFADTARIISETFINMIKMVIAPIIFLTIVLGIASMGDMKKVGRVGGKALLYFEIVTTFALIIGLFVAHYTEPGRGVNFNHEGVADIQKYKNEAAEINWIEFFTHIVPSNVFKAFTDGNILQVLFFSILFGLGLTKLGEQRQPLLRSFDRFSKVLFNIMKMIMRLAPLGAFGGMAYTIGTHGIEALAPMGRLMLSVYATMILFIFVCLNIICRMYKFSLWKYLKFIKEEILIVLGTSSSESVLPNIMQKMEDFGCSRSVVGLVIPTGYSFNLDGTTIYLSMATIFLAQVFHVDLSFAQLLTIIGILLVTSKGAAAVTGGGFIVLAGTLTALKVIPVEGMAILLGVDRFMSEARAITNLIGNGVATVVIAKSEKEFDEEKYQNAISEL
ncbi:C4-dicarboxylate transporter DctA [Sphingobacterium spiritivorum ATCC 33300]|uniref:C4-dicarboxylate transporter DctA n=1 Tax=Sphingobacterium spiritivorum ATCC 33300 TaxID=525372 RepID=C2FRR7_SPHSI|nr:dicarboxylate/amino acid:cation symporter [Sphingobacterium spiritivorum]EEI94282.1 C4-dicarboxylate transporter DctA [Sphingobacterium spiritivorum ATCC 33300]QQS98118.1 dicarboxylate/amino acid:cation symporter [Sphingobacterium spiritivorum]